MANHRFFQQFGKAMLLIVIFPLWIVSAFGFFRVTIIPCARSIISYLVSRLPSRHWITGIKSWLSPPYIYIVLSLIILAIAAQNHLLQVPSRQTKTKQNAEKISEEKEESSDFSTDKKLAANICHSPAAVAFPEDQESKLGDRKSDEDGEPVLDTLEEAWKMIMEAQGKKAR